MSNAGLEEATRALNRALARAEKAERERDAWRRKYKAQLEANDLLAKEVESRRDDLAGLAERENGKLYNDGDS